MLFGFPLRALRDIKFSLDNGFDFGEVHLSGERIRRLWLESGVINDESGLMLTAHGPLEEVPIHDRQYFWNNYVPSIEDAIRTCHWMRINNLTIHLCMNVRFIKEKARRERIDALGGLVEYASRNKILLCLENVTESAEDIINLANEVPGLCFTLDIGHGQLGRPENICFEIIREIPDRIRHVHLHDNFGGDQGEDIHSAIGEGIIDFKRILSCLIHAGYKETAVLEVKKDGALLSLDNVKRLFCSRTTKSESSN